MSEINLGRVQGGGFFGSTSTSETSIAKATVSTSGITPLVGDTIVNANGALCRISSESTGTYYVIKYNSIRGIQGVKGDKGEQGERGLQGRQGVKGDKGERGIQGERGEQGIQGERGGQGIQGIKGEKGDKGDKGLGYTDYIAGTVPLGKNILSTTTITNKDTDYNVYILNNTISDNTLKWVLTINYSIHAYYNIYPASVVYDPISHEFNSKGTFLFEIGDNANIPVYIPIVTYSYIFNSSNGTDRKSSVPTVVGYIELRYVDPQTINVKFLSDEVDFKQAGVTTATGSLIIYPLNAYIPTL